MKNSLCWNKSLKYRWWCCQYSVGTKPISESGPEVIKLLSCSTRLSMKFFILINVKMPTVVGFLTFMSRKNSILGLCESEKSLVSWYFYAYEHLKFHAQLSWAWKKVLEPRVLILDLVAFSNEVTDSWLYIRSMSLALLETHKAFTVFIWL